MASSLPTAHRDSSISRTIRSISGAMNLNSLDILASISSRKRAPRPSGNAGCAVGRLFVVPSDIAPLISLASEPDDGGKATRMPMSITSRSEQNRLICNGMKVEWHYLDLRADRAAMVAFRQHGGFLPHAETRFEGGTLDRRQRHASEP
jgi:hypothetical protein